MIYPVLHTTKFEALLTIDDGLGSLLIVTKVYELADAQVSQNT